AHRRARVAGVRGEARDRVVSREARHEVDRDARARAPREVADVAQLQLEEGAPVHRLHPGLHDAAEARGHPAGEHDHADLASRDPLEAARGEPLALRAPERGEARDVALPRGLDAPADPVGAGARLAAPEALAQRLEGLEVEA